MTIQDTEIWKDIEGYEGLYQVSSHGRVKSLRREASNNLFINGHSSNPIRVISERILASNLRGKYLRVTLCNDTDRKAFSVNVLVAKAFVPNPHNKPEVNHIDGVQLNNRADNLEWSTTRENMDHALANGLIKKGVNRHNSKMTAEQLEEALYFKNKGLKVTLIAEHLNLPYGVVSGHLRRKLKEADDANN